MTRRFLLALTVATSFLTLGPAAGNAGGLNHQPALDMTGAHLNVAQAGAGLGGDILSPGDGFPVRLPIDIHGPVRAARLYFGGFMNHPSADEGDRDLFFDGQPISGDVVGREVISDDGLVTKAYAIAFDVTSLVRNAVTTDGPGSFVFPVADADLADNADRAHGVGLVVLYEDPSAVGDYRVILKEGIDYAFERFSGTPAGSTEPVIFDHGSSASDRNGQFVLLAGAGFAQLEDELVIGGQRFVDVVDSSEGNQWDTDILEVTISAGSAETSAQLFAGNDSVFWVAGALRVPEAGSCGLEVTKTCATDTPPQGALLCESAIVATTLRYIGPDIAVADVVLSGKNGTQAVYNGVELISGVTELRSASQNGFTIDAGSERQLGSKTTIVINGVTEIIHTSCSAIYEAGQPAPLDGNTPNPPGSDKGDPSPNWFVVDFLDKDGASVSMDDLGSGTDHCTVSGPTDVTYTYEIANHGGQDLFDLTVEDSEFVVWGSPIDHLPMGTRMVLTETAEITETTTNTVEVIGTTAGGAICRAMDRATVEVDEIHSKKKSKKKSKKGKKIEHSKKNSKKNAKSKKAGKKSKKHGKKK